MSNTDKFISISEAASLLNITGDRITWLIGIGELSSMKSAERKGGKSVSLQDVHRLQTSPLIARWLIYSLVDPRDHAIRYVGQTNEPLVRFHNHLCERSDIGKYKWILELKKHD